MGREVLRKLARIKNLVRKNIVKLVFSAILAFILSVLALSPGIGYAATVEVTSSELLLRGHRCFGEYRVPDCEHSGGSSCWCIVGWLDQGILNVTFNRGLYPVNHLLNNELSTNFTSLTKSWVSQNSMKEGVVMQAILTDFLLNVPLFYVAGLILAVGVEKSLSLLGFGRKHGDLEQADSTEFLISSAIVEGTRQ